MSTEAQDCYFQWRNTLDLLRPDLPAPFGGFLPKAFGYAARLAGVIHAMTALHSGEDIPAELSREATPEEHVPTTRAMGGMLRACDLNITTGKHDANGHRACRCFIWDEQVTAFLETMRRSLHCQQTLAQQGFPDEDMDFDEPA